MKRPSIVLAAFLLLSAVSASAQTAFAKGDIVLNLGIGAVNTVYDNSYFDRFPPLSLSVEYGIADNLVRGKASVGIGGVVDYTHGKHRNALGIHDWNRGSVDIGLRGAFHYHWVVNLDTYAGLMLGGRINSTRIKDSSPYGSAPDAGGDFAWGLYVGARYYFVGGLAVFSEIGYDTSVFKFGLAYRF